MADIALIFHWSPADMDPMPVEDLMMWRGLAVERWNRVNKAEG